MRPSLQGLTLLAACALLASACSDAAVELAPGPTGRPVLCETALDCQADGYRCEANLCVADRPNELTISLQVRPPATSGLLKEQFSKISLRDGRRLPDLMLSRPVTLSGQVRIADNPLAASIPARIVASRQDTILGTSIRVETIASDGEGYSLSLIPGTYDLAVFPENDAFPSYKRTDLPVRQDTLMDITLPAWEDYFEVSGRVVVEEGDDRGVAAIRVQAFSPGLVNLSAPAVTDPDGEFHLVFPPIVQTYTLRLSPSPENPLYPQVDVADLQIDGDGDLGDIALGGGGGPATRVTGRAIGADDSGPVPSCNLEFSLPLGRGTFTRTLSTDESGGFEDFLLNGSYSVRIVPSSESPLAVTHREDVLISGDADERANPIFELGDFSVAPKRTLAGVVLDATGDNRLAHVTIEVLLTGNGNVRGLHRRQVTSSQEDGTFALFVDPGYHDITLIPPESSGQPRWTLRNLDIHADIRRDLQLKAPDLIMGVVRDPDGIPLSDATVEVLIQQDNNQEEAVLVGLGTTNEVGGYVIVLPNP